MLIDPVILAQIGLAWIFIRYLLQHDRGSKEPAKIVIMAGILGGLATIAALFLEKWLLPDKLITNPLGLSTGSLVGSSLLIGVIEEGVKSLPLAFFIYRQRYFDEITDGIIYFATAGMIFGLLEDIGYDLSYGDATGLTRIIAGPYLHAGLCALFGYMLARRKVLKTNRAYVVAGLLAAMTLHGLYDLGLFYQKGWSLLMSLLITAAVNFGVFLLFKYSQRSDRSLGLAAAGPNYYCTFCGRPNERRFVYCVFCGHKT